MAPRPAVRAAGLSVRYLTRRKPALRNLDLVIDEGERVLIAGASGSGKSTLGLCLTGLIPTCIDADMEGEIEVAGKATVEHPPGELAQRVGIVFQDPTSQFTMLTVGDEVAFGLENIGLDTAAMRSRVPEALAAVGLAERADWRLDRLSGGQQQRVVLAAALAMRSEILVLDEPTAHLDPRAGSELYEHLRRVAENLGTTLIITEHDTDKVIPALAQRCLLLDRDGSAVLDRSAIDLFGSTEDARLWVDAGLQLPSATALAMAIGAEAHEVSMEVDAAAAWLARTSRAQLRLRTIDGSTSGVASGDVVLDASNLSHRFRTPLGDHAALSGAGLTLREGEFVALVGRNGSGKTTLLRALTGLIKPESGRVCIDGRDVEALGARAVARLSAHVFQNPESGFVAATVAEELAYSPRALGWSQATIDRYVSESLERYGLTALRDANPYTLSGGQKRRLSVASALLLDPRVVLLDEPTFGQDRRSADALMGELARLRGEGLAALAATHDPRVIAEEADRIVALDGGNVVFDGPPDQYFADDDLLATTGQEKPVLRRILYEARSRGADVPVDLRWRDLPALRVREAIGMRHVS